MAHTMNRAWAKAVVVSLVISALFTISASIVFGGGAKYLPPAEHRQIASMTYEEATKYLLERTQRISGWEAFLDGAKSSEFWFELMQWWLFMALFAFVACAALLLWQGRAPSNSASLTDTSTSPLRAQHGAAKRERSAAD